MDNGNPEKNEGLPHRRVPSTVRSQQEQTPPDETKRRTSSGSGREVKTAVLAIGIPALVAVVGIAALVMWVVRDREAVDVEARAPERPTSATTASEPQAEAEQSQPSTDGGSDAPAGAGTGADSSAGATPPDQGGEAAAPTASTPTAATRSGGTAANLPGSWPRFRGANFDNISTERVGLARSWTSGPRRLWAVKLGQGYAGAAGQDGPVDVLDYDESARADVLRCLSLADGKQIWGQAYSVELKENHGLSRTVPAVAGDYVVTIGPKCHVMCCRATSGERLWGIDLHKAYGTKVPPWYAGQCPLIDNGKAIIAPGGSALMIAVDCATGKVLWQTPNPRGWKMTHSSIIPMKLGGQRVYVYPASGGVVAISPSDGRLLWEFSDWTVNTANAPSPVPIGDGRIFLCGGYGAGSMMIKVAGAKVSSLGHIGQNVFGSHQQTPILYNGYLYGVSIGDQQLVCLDLKGNRVWSSGHTAKFGLCPYLIAEGIIYVLDEGGNLTLVEANPSGYKQLAQAKVLDGSHPWGPMALVGGRLICRDMSTMVCLDVKSG